jgi:2-iminoacetate synthase ThiH
MIRIHRIQRKTSSINEMVPLNIAKKAINKSAMYGGGFSPFNDQKMGKPKIKFICKGKEK